MLKKMILFMLPFKKGIQNLFSVHFLLVFDAEPKNTLTFLFG